MPYAAPPVGNLRFAAPQEPTKFSGVRQATTYGAACPQLALAPGGGPPSPPTSQSEDCLFINVVKPANRTSEHTLPVLIWIYGGAFQIGDTSQSPGGPVVNRSIQLGQPVIFVSFNYRVNGFGFLGGAEIKAAKLANAGIRDQRFAMQWVQTYITEFGGNPTKVTIWGESAGAVSIGLHFVIDDGDSGGLFRGAFMESGSPIFLPDVLNHQVYFDQVVSATNCTSASDKIQCLRGVSFDQLAAAFATNPGGFQLTLSYQPTTDGDVFVRDPYLSLQQGKYAKVPYVTGDCEDEGTLFSLGNSNITYPRNNAQFLDYMKNTYFPSINATQLASLEAAYPDDPTQGSPFNTGTDNAMTPEFKRLAAVQGDLAFQAPRRFFLNIASKTQPTWAFRYLKGFGTSVLGVSHGSDIPFFFNGLNDTRGVDALVYFINSLDPNPSHPSDSDCLWPKYTTAPLDPALMTFIDTAPFTSITSDIYRAGPMDLLNDFALGQIGHGV